jgi:diaminopimelate epimerase
VKISKYHALGNDYLVLEPKDSPNPPSQRDICLICHRNFGIGSDGILYGPTPSDEADFGLRIYNPDGSEAEKSGNGLRIFSRYLWDCGLVSKEPFTVITAGGKVTCQICEESGFVTVEMGRVSFHSRDIPIHGEAREVLNESIDLKGKSYRFYGVTIGNPHVVLPLPDVSRQEACRLGSILETHPLFPNRTNVQLLKVLDSKNIQIEIWERGAGYTLASGSSSCAAAAVARKMGLVEPDLTVHMPGGKISIHIAQNYAITMKGPVTRIAEVDFDVEALKFELRC